MLIVAPIAVGISLVIFGLVTYVTRYVSLGSLIGAMSTVALLLLQVAISDADPAYLIFGILGVAIILWQHRDNVKRLIDRTERRLGQSDDSILTK